MPRSLAILLLLLTFTTLACSSPHPQTNNWLTPPQVPATLTVPAGNSLLYHARATGSQIYIAKPSPDGKLAWTLKAPSADLFDQSGHKVGTHFAGPTWEINGTKIVAQKLQSSPADGSVDWLLLKTKSTEGPGPLSKVTFIQRLNTTAGNPPAAVPNGTREGAELPIPYTADYYFYAPRQTR